MESRGERERERGLGKACQLTSSVLILRFCTSGMAVEEKQNAVFSRQMIDLRSSLTGVIEIPGLYMWHRLVTSALN